MLLQLLSDLVKVDDILFIVQNVSNDTTSTSTSTDNNGSNASSSSIANNAISEIKSNFLDTIKQREKWITIGNNDGPAHMHINSELIRSAEFIQEQKPQRTSYSVRFFDASGNRVFAAFFTKMYDDSKQLILQRDAIYRELQHRYGSELKF